MLHNYFWHGPEIPVALQTSSQISWNHLLHTSHLTHPNSANSGSSIRRPQYEHGISELLVFLLVFLFVFLLVPTFDFFEIVSFGTFFCFSLLFHCVSLPVQRFYFSVFRFLTALLCSVFSFDFSCFSFILSYLHFLDQANSFLIDRFSCGFSNNVRSFHYNITE